MAEAVLQEEEEEQGRWWWKEVEMWKDVEVSWRDDYKQASGVDRSLSLGPSGRAVGGLAQRLHALPGPA